MKKYFIFIFLFLTPLFIQANDLVVNECKSDIYFANGIMTDDGNATINLDLIRTRVLIEQYDENISKMDKELNFKKAYNQTYDFSGDVYEAYLQLANESDGWLSFYGFMSFILGNTGNDSDWYNRALALVTENMSEAMIRQVYEADLTVQIQDYKNSIASGHGVIVVSHSQGNLFTNDAYANVTQDDGSWRKDYFTAVAVASPATKLLEDDNNDPHIGFDNDFVAWLGTLGTIENPNRSYKYINALDELVENSFDLQFHSFDYYMGEHIIFQDGVNERNITTDIGKQIIMSFLSDAVENHRDAPSQWQTDQEFNKGTNSYSITVKHRFDSTITSMNGVDVYPFKPSAKLYHVTDNIGGNGWLKASCGGSEVFDSWDEQNENEFYLINNPEREKISIIQEVMITGNTIKNVCLIEELKSSWSSNNWESWCGNGSALNTFISSWDWMTGLEGCEFEKSSGTYYDSVPSENWKLVHEEILSSEVIKSFDSGYKWGENGHYIPGTGHCSTGMFGGSSFLWVADINVGYTTTERFKRTYEIKD